MIGHDAVKSERQLVDLKSFGKILQVGVTNGDIAEDICLAILISCGAEDFQRLIVSVNGFQIVTQSGVEKSDIVECDTLSLRGADQLVHRLRLVVRIEALLILPEIRKGISQIVERGGLAQLKVSLAPDRKCPITEIHRLFKLAHVVVDRTDVIQEVALPYAIPQLF